MDFDLKQKDIEWITTQYPTLKFDVKKQEVIGDIYINRSYNGYSITDVYTIKVVFKKFPNTTLPKVYEISGKIENIAKELNKCPLDMHVNTHADNSLCLVIQDKEKECFNNGFTIKEFFENCIENFLFWVSYYGETGMPPWEEYAHGQLGFFEMFAENELSYKMLVRKFNVFEVHQYLLVDTGRKCLCGSTKEMELCHPLVYKGLSKMQNTRLLISLQMNKLKGYLITRPLISPTIYSKIS